RGLATSDSGAGCRCAHPGYESSPLRSHPRSVGHECHSLPFDNHPIGVRLTVNVEIESGALVGVAEIEIATGERDLVPLGRASRDDLAGGRDDAATADVVDALLDTGLGDAHHEGA